MEGLVSFVSEQPALASALAVIVVLLTILGTNSASNSSSAKDVPAAAAGASKKKKKKATKTNTKKPTAPKTNGAAKPAAKPAAKVVVTVEDDDDDDEEEEENKAAPVPVPVPVPVPETTTSSNKKKKKKKAAVVAKEEAPVVVVKEPVVEKVVVPEPEPVVETPPADAAAAGKKKKKKKKKTNAETPSEEKKEDKKANGGAEDEEDDDDDALATFAKGSREKKKKNGISSATEEVDDWNVINKTKGKGKKAAAVIAAAEPEELLEGDPADDKPAFLQMEITAADIPTIIGPKGTTIQQIQMATGTTVDIDKALGVIKVKGDDEEKMQAALGQIRDILDAKKAKTAHTATLTGADIKGSDGVKAIIGKGGAMIKEIQSTTGCKIDADIDKGTVVIAGPSEASVKDAVQKCKDAVFGAANCTMDLKSKSMVFCICGRSFGELQSLQTQTGARLDMTGSVLTISGDVEKVQQAFSVISAKMERCKGVTLVIDKNIGAVMGKGGANIRQIQEKTGAFIEISQANECKIVGEPDAVKAAETSVRKAMAGEIELKPGEVLEKLELGVGTSMVIGTGGAKIKELQKEHGVQINVQITTATLVGKKDAVAAAQKAIMAIVTPLIERAKAEEAARKESEKLVAAGDTTWAGDGKDDDADGW